LNNSKTALLSSSPTAEDLITAVIVPEMLLMRGRATFGQANAAPSK
jgi:hypothetical protein